MSTSSQPSARRSIAFVAAPHEENGGGMGRVKDYILQAPPGTWGNLTVEPLITRDHGGRLASLALVARACFTVLRARLNGTLGLVHVNFGDRGSAVRKSLLLLFSRLLGAPVFLHFHAVLYEEDVARLGPVGRWFAYLPFRCATCVIVLGERWRRWLTDEVRLKDVPIEILTNGVPIEIFEDRRQTKRDQMLRILFLGNLIERKGVSDLIQALAKLPADLPPWEARFAGNGDVAHYTAIAENAGITERVGFMGWVGQDTARILTQSSDLLVLPSYHEGLPLVVLEALGQGTPVITTPVGAVPELLTDGENVMFVPPGDVAALSAMIERLLKDHDLRQRLVVNGKRIFDQQFSIAAFRANLGRIWARYDGLSQPAVDRADAPGLSSPFDR